MGKKIEFNFEGKDYTLGFTKDTVATLDRRGFKISELNDKSMTMLPMLFHGAFLARHPKISQDLTDRMLPKFKRKQDLWRWLGEAYSEPILALTDEPDEDSEGNIDWTESESY